MKNILSKKQVVLASHISDLAGPTEALVKYLIPHTSNLTVILNPLEYCVEKKREVTTYANGVLSRKKIPTNYRPTKVLSWLIDTVVTLRESFVQGKIDIFIACDPLMGIVGVLLKKFNKVEKLVLYTIDWTDRRFENPTLNSIYYFLDNVVAKNSDSLWCISLEIRKLRKLTYPVHKVIHVPVGVYPHEVKTYGIHSKTTLVFLGAFEESKGIEIVIEAWMSLLKIIPQLKLVFIGRTPSSIKKDYEKIISKMPRTKNLGTMTHEKIMKTIGKYGIGLAPYSSSFSSISKYADPSRIKDYLACGLPIITTIIPPIHKLIKTKDYGVIMEEPDTVSLVRSVQKVLYDYQNYRDNLANMKTKYNWETIFRKAFDQTYV